MSRPDKAVNISTHDQKDCWTNPNCSNSPQNVTISVTRGLHYDIEKQDREKMEQLETGSFSVPVMDSSSRISLCLKDMDSTVGNLLETFGEHAQSAVGGRRSGSSSSQTKKEAELQVDLQSEEKIKDSRIKSSDYPKKCLICNKTFNNVEQLVSHFMETSQKDVWPDSARNLQQIVSNRACNTAEQDEPTILETNKTKEKDQNVTVHCTGFEPPRNKSGSGLEHVAEEISLTDSTLAHARNQNKQTAVLTREKTNICSPKNNSRRLRNSRQPVGKHKYVKRKNVKYSSKNKIPNNSGKETKTCAVKPKSQQLTKGTVNSPRMAQQVKYQMPRTLIPINTSGITSATNTANPLITVPRQVENVSREGHPRGVEPSTAPQISSAAQMTLSANSNTAANTGPNPFEIMKKLTGLLALYRSKVQQETSQQNSVILSIPVQPQVSVASTSLVSFGSYKRKYGSLEKPSDFGCGSQLASDNRLMKKKVPQNFPVASANQQSTLLESNRVCLGNERAVSENSSNTVPSNHSECSNNVLKIVDASGKMVLHNSFVANPTNTISAHSSATNPTNTISAHSSAANLTNTISAHNSANTALRPPHPLVSSGKWIIYHLPATFTSTSTANQSQVKGIYLRTGHEHREDTSTAPFPSQGKTCPPQSGLRCPAKNMIIPLSQCQKLGQSQVCVNRISVSTLPRGMAPVKEIGSCSAGNGVWSGLSRQQPNPLGVETRAKTHSNLLQSPSTTSYNRGHQFSTNVTSSGQTGGLLQSSIILQPTATSSMAGRPIVHVPLLDGQDRRPRDGYTKLPASAESTCAMGSDIRPLDNLNASVHSSSVGNKTNVVPLPTDQLSYSNQNTRNFPC